MLTFLFPAWQGAGDKAVYHGAMVMQRITTQPLMIHADISLSDDLEIKNGIIGYDTILKQMAAAQLMLEQQSCSKILTFGGGCDTEILPVSYLNQLYGGDLAIVWFDAHGDLNTPASSPSGLFHGMPLRCLLNEGDEQIRKHCLSFIKPQQIVFAGCRDFDEPERIYVSETNIPCIPPDTIQSGRRLCGILSEKAYHRVYIHIDLDVLSPVAFPSVMCPAPGGITVETLIETLKRIHSQFEVIGIGIVEYSPEQGDCEDILKTIIACCEDILA